MEHGKASLGWVEAALPAPTPAVRMALADRHGLALEVACGGVATAEEVAASGLEVLTVQAWRMHELHPLATDARVVDAARNHVVDALAMARTLGARRVLTVCGFGADAPTDPLGRCLDFFAALVPAAREHDVRISIELLSPRRAAAMTTPAELERLLDGLACPDVFGTTFDTGHLLDAGRDPEPLLSSWPHPIDELQLRGPNSRPPGRDLSLRAWWQAAGRPPAVVEHRAGALVDVAEFTELVQDLRRELE